MMHISREKINDQWATAIAECEKVGMSHHEYSVERRRNYEIEHDLSDIFGVEHVISEWCPFNGIYSSWADHCPISELRQIVDENIGKGIVDHYNLDYLANYAEGIINKREGIL